ncbi:MAG: phage recombination protein Bet [Solirubrobacterales bacterium]|nr:phage recombination protein Bet [Solirubrobacterales bacterium]
MSRRWRQRRAVSVAADLLSNRADRTVLDARERSSMPRTSEVVRSAPGPNGAGATGTEPQSATRAERPARRLSEDERRLIASTLMSPRDREASGEERELFWRQIERTGLDPFARQIYVVYRYSRRRRREEMSIETSIDGLRLIAERTGAYEGQTRPYWCGEDGVWHECWASVEAPVAATVGVHKGGAREATWATAHFVEYAEFWDDSGKAKGFYATMPRNQLSKCAEALALRKAFPAEMSGLYTAEEMARADAEAPRARPEGVDPVSGEPAASSASEATGAADVPEGAGANGELGGRPVSEGMRAIATAGPAAPAQHRRALRDRMAAACVSREAVAKLARLYFSEARSDCLTEAQMAELAELVEAIGAGQIADETLKAQLTKAEVRPDRVEARALITMWILGRANERTASTAAPKAPDAPGERAETTGGEA